MYEKNSREAAALTPAAPMGASGSKFPARNAENATTTKNTRRAIFTSTMRVFTQALSFAPGSRTSIAMTTSAAAGRFTKPPSPGGADSTVGRCSPKTRSVSSTYSLAPTATAATDTAYSRTRHHPQTQAIPSPMVA